MSTKAFFCLLLGVGLSQVCCQATALTQPLRGKLERIDITGITFTNPDYIRSRLNLAVSDVIDPALLEEALRLLETDPIFRKVRGKLEPGSTSGSVVLKVEVEEANQIGGSVSLDNYSPPALGSERLGVGLQIRNFSGNGDILSASYFTTIGGGSNIYDFNYSIPVSPLQGTVSIRYAPSNFRIIQEPLKVFNFQGNAGLLEVSYRQPLVRNLHEEFALSLTYSYQTGQTFIDNFAFPFSIGPDSEGRATTSVFRFGQDYLSRDVSGAWSLKSSFNLGTGLFGGTFITVPNAGFFSWNGQVQRIQSVGADAFLIGSLDAQLSANPLLSSQQFVVGGANSVRGFRQNVRAGDNGIRASVEGRFTVLRNESADRRAIIQLAPFVDVGAIWNNGQNPNPLPSQNFLAGGGLGIIIEPVQNLLLRVDATIPFVNLADRGNNLQESSVFFNIGYRF